jgi:UDP:flavonoid glycosyltransferase YjiC (YdhE family)
MSAPKPLVLVCAFPAYGHLMPIRAIAKALVLRGYEVTFVTGSAYRELIEAIGANFIPLEGYSDLTEGDLDRMQPLRDAIPAGPLQIAYDLETIFVNTIPGQHAAQQKALKSLTEQHPGRPIVLVYEGFFLGSGPGLLGAPGIRPAGTIGIGIVPMVLQSIDTAPFGPGLPPDSSAEGRARNIAMNKQLQEVLAKPQAAYEQIFQELGATQPAPYIFNAIYQLPDRFLQMCIPSVEYPRSDLPPKVHFAGGLPRGLRDPFTDTPSWWPEVTNNSTKKIVAVSQGTAAINLNDLVIPTMNGLKDRSDVLVVVALGRKGSALPEGTVIPENARVTDFIPFDDLLPHCEVFITNGGYGAFQHAISNGTPLVIGGATEDKPEVAQRAAWAGIGVNLKTGSPSPEQVKEAVEEIFANERYRTRSRELEKEMKKYNPMDVVASSIEDMAAAAN